MNEPEPAHVLLHVEVSTLDGRVRMKITRSDSPVVLTGVMTPAEARRIAQQLIQAAGKC